MIGLKMNKKLLLSKEIYSINRIEEACEAFSHIVLIEIEDSLNYWKCDFSNCKFDEEKTALEFENYLIGITNKEG